MPVSVLLLLTLASVAVALDKPSDASSRGSRVAAGLLAGTLSSVVLQPLEVVKTRMQTTHKDGTGN